MWYKGTDDTEIRKRIETALSKAGEAAETVQNGSRFTNRHIFLLEYIVTVPVAPVLCYFIQGTEGFRVKDGCISCGKCARLCPMNIIEMRETPDGSAKIPVWTLKRCAHCMSCIQNCPVEMIEYKSITEGRKRYTAARYPVPPA